MEVLTTASQFISRDLTQGTSWLHVGTDQPFISISIGAFYQVWAIARDGSAFYRGSVSPSKPAGKNLYFIFCSTPLPGLKKSNQTPLPWQHIQIIQ